MLISRIKCLFTNFLLFKTYKSKRASKEHNSSPDDGPWQHDLDQEQDAHPRTTHLQKRQQYVLNL